MTTISEQPELVDQPSVFDGVDLPVIPTFETAAAIREPVDQPSVFDGLILPGSDS
jgi:hypothetical protein